MIRLLRFATLGSLLAFAGCGPGREPMPPVIVVSIDTLRADRLPAYGYRGIEAPAIAAFAADALLFENAYSACPLTLPSHSSLFTGLRPFEHGVRDNLGYRLEEGKVETLAELLLKRGYRTGGAVSAYVLRRDTGIAQGFEHWDDEIETRADLTLDRLERRGDDTLARAESWIGERGEEPFFFFLHLFEPHDPYEPPEPFRSRYTNAYDGEVAAADALFGRLVSFLRGRGLYERALIVLLSDHGEDLGDHGEGRHGILLYRSTLHVPLLVKLPGQQRGGTRVASPAQLVDVLPTIAGVLGAPAPAGVAGSSLLRLADGGVGERRLYSESFYGRIHYGWSPLRSLVDARFQFIESPDPELYDLPADPRQRTNVLAANRRIFHERRQELDALPTGFEAPAAVDPEEAAKLQALGYVAAPAVADGANLPDPKANLHLLVEIQRAVDLRASGRLVEAVTVLKSLQQHHPELQDTYLLLAPALRGLGRFEEALAVCQVGRRLLPSLDALFALEAARNHLALGAFAEVEREARLGEGANPAQSAELLARAALGRGDAQAAADIVARSLAGGGAPRVATLHLAAEVAIAREDFPRALEHLDAAKAQIAAGKSSPVVMLEADRGDCLARLGRYAEAEQAFREEMRRFPANRQAFVRLAFLLGAMRRFEEIEPLLEAMLHARPERETYLVAAKTLESLGNADAAARWRARAARVP